jgi:hypothetical protein
VELLKPIGQILEPLRALGILFFSPLYKNIQVARILPNSLDKSYIKAEFLAVSGDQAVATFIRG